MQKPFYLTTTLPYVNAPLHLGHALEFVRADAVARYHALQDEDVFFNTGTDEHGQKIADRAKERGTSPQAFVDENFLGFEQQVLSFGMTDTLHYIRTTDPVHIAAAQAFWTQVAARGYIYKKNYQAKYCIGCEAVKTESELVNGECPDHPGVPLELINEENYFFKFSAFQDALRALYEARPDFVIPNFRFNEVKAFVSRGLEDFSISRLKSKMSWGIPVPGDDDHVMYVWFDALTNYISTLGWPTDMTTFQKYWVQGTPTQYCGKDNTRFQAVMWQAMLMAADLPPTYQIIVNGHITAEGGVKMSKSLGNVIDPLALSTEYGIDALRLFLLKEVSSFEDSACTIERFRQAYQAHLANGLGNLTSRILTLSEQYCDPFEDMPGTELDAPIKAAMAGYDLQAAVNVIWDAIGVLDAKIAAEKPFSVVKVDVEEGTRMIAELVRSLYTISVALQPFLPQTSERIMALIRDNKKPDAPLFARLV
jgi:methionyl-tRNA synthetase